MVQTTAAAIAALAHKWIAAALQRDLVMEFSVWEIGCQRAIAILDAHSASVNRRLSDWAGKACRKKDDTGDRKRHKQQQMAIQTTSDEYKQQSPHEAGFVVDGDLTMTYFRMGNPYYHRRDTVSRPCSGWEGVGPACYARQEFGWSVSIGVFGLDRH